MKLNSKFDPRKAYIPEGVQELKQQSKFATIHTKFMADQTCTAVTRTSREFRMQLLQNRNFSLSTFADGSIRPVKGLEN